MDFGMSAKAAFAELGVAVAGKVHAAGQAGGLAKACNAAWCRNSGLPGGSQSP